MNLKQNHYSRRALALLLTLVMCVGMIPTALPPPPAPTAATPRWCRGSSPAP